jgi:hypothetical protein
MPLSLMSLSFMPLSVAAPFRFCLFPFMPLSGGLENVDYAGFLYANIRHPHFFFFFFFFFFVLILWNIE